VQRCLLGTASWARNSGPIIAEARRCLALMHSDYDEFRLSSLQFLLAVCLKAQQQDREAIVEYAIGCHCEEREQALHGEWAAPESNLPKMVRVFDCRVRRFSQTSGLLRVRAAVHVSCACIRISSGLQGSGVHLMTHCVAPRF
jgi:hypothetical protein